MTAIALCLTASFARLCWLTWLIWRTPTHVGARHSVVPDCRLRGGTVDRVV